MVKMPLGTPALPMKFQSSNPSSASNSSFLLMHTWEKASEGLAMDPCHLGGRPEKTKLPSDHGVSPFKHK